jgi:DNA-binding beta-propeller fold protein YncE
MASADKVSSPLFDSPSSGAEKKKGSNNGLSEEAAKAKVRKRRRRKIALLLLIIAIIAYLVYRALSGGSSLPIIGSDLPAYDSSIYGVTQPMGVAVSPDGNRVYVTESGGHRLVRVFDSSGDEVGTLKPPGGDWRLPVYVAVNPDGEDVYVSDRLRETIDVYDSDGKYLKDIKPDGSLGKGANPLGLAFGPEGNLYATDAGGDRESHRVLVFGGGNEPLRKIGEPGAFWFPNGLAVDSDGNVYVADSNDGRLAIFDSSGKLQASIRRGVGEGDLGLPRGVAIDDGRLFVSDTTAHVVKVYKLGDPAEVPAYVGSFGVEGIADGAFEYPNGIAIAPDGRIYVTDRENNRVQVWSY